MNKKWMNQLSGASLISLGLLTTPNVMAGTDLPYVGPESETCNIKSPEGRLAEIDGGYVTNEDCTKVYIKPPILGELIVSQPTVYGTVDYCEGVSEFRKKISDQKFGIQSGKMSPSEIIRAINTIEMMNKKLSDFERSTGTAARFSGIVHLNWTKMIKAYEKANPELLLSPMGKVSFKRMPIAVGGLKANLIDVNQNQDFLDDENGDGIIRRLSIGGQEIQVNDDGFSIANLPNQWANLFNGSYLMGQIANMELELGLRGACALFSDKNTSNSVNTYFNPTYTYLYPVQTKSFFKVEIDGEMLKSKMIEIVERKGPELSVSQLKDELGGANPIRVTLNEGLASNIVDKLENEYKKEMKEIVLESVLVAASTKTKAAIAENMYTDREQRSTRACKRKWYGRKKCWTHYYYVDVERLNKQGFVESVMKMSDLNSSSQVDKYTTLFMIDTVAFAAKEKKENEND